MTQTYQGGCHCGAVRFETKIDPSHGTEKCNCTICAKMRLWSFNVPPDAFTLLQGEASLTDYVYGAKVAHHYFCKHCGIHAFDRVDLPPPLSTYYNVAVTCLDNIDIDAVLAAPISYQDGLHDAWDQKPDKIGSL